ncbi:Uma2 family endonuclease [Nocardia sp. alder85J]|uniref:Uma2 family endonuclease n=1 Tax=Nocardia sp. alder85J TaxID=2862949 RepID=UPI001CD75B91|nr:Uma2 family endonuclease [Nocardia sp. alder85J]MCX4094776.1 Uma2 family endonuclease [Nocardia sp. alder85J]
MSAEFAVQPELPAFMTWEELERLPEEIAGEIELWDRRVVWVRRGPAEHSIFTARMWNSFERCVRDHAATGPDECWRAGLEINVFFGRTGKNSFLTPDFLIHRCLDRPYQDVRAEDVLLAGEVLSPSNSSREMEIKRARYASGGIPWYWEVHLHRETSAIEFVRAYALETRVGRLPDGVQPRYRSNYLFVNEWTPDDEDGIRINFPFPISIPWSDLEY